MPSCGGGTDRGEGSASASAVARHRTHPARVRQPKPARDCRGRSIARSPPLATSMGLAIFSQPLQIHKLCFFTTKAEAGWGRKKGRGRRGAMSAISSGPPSLGSTMGGGSQRLSMSSTGKGGAEKGVLLGQVLPRFVVTDLRAPGHPEVQISSLIKKRGPTVLGTVAYEPVAHQQKNKRTPARPFPRSPAPHPERLPTHQSCTHPSRCRVAQCSWPAGAPHAPPSWSSGPPWCTGSNRWRSTRPA